MQIMKTRTVEAVSKSAECLGSPPLLRNCSANELHFPTPIANNRPQRNPTGSAAAFTLSFRSARKELSFANKRQNPYNMDDCDSSERNNQTMHHNSASRKHTYASLMQRLFLVCISLCLAVASLPAHAEEYEKNTLRVGYWAFDGYHNMDPDGVRSGYGYALLQLMARYSNIGFTYHGYEQSFAQNKQMLEDGEIDLLTAVKKSKDNIDRFDFSEHSIGSASTILTIKAGNSRIISGHYETYQGMRIGIVSDAVREEELSAYAQEKGFSYELVYYETSPALAQALQNEEIDAIASTSLRARTNEWTIDSFSDSLMYIAVRKGDRKTLELVNASLERMNIEEQHWILDLTKKYYGNSESNIPFFTEAEKAYLEQKREEGRVFRVLVNPDRRPYSYVNDEGQIAGIMPDTFQLIAEMAGISYEWVIPTDRDHYTRLLRGQNIDICIDLVSDFHTAEELGYSITDSYLTAPFAWIRRKDHTDNIEVAAQVLHSTYSSEKHYYNSEYTLTEYVTYPTREECILSVVNGETDGFCTYAYEAEQFVLNHPEAELMTMASQSSNSFSIGVSRNVNSHLTSILNTVISCIDNSQNNQIIRKHTSLSVPEYSLFDLVRTNRQLHMIIVLTVIAFTLLMLVIYQQLRYQRALKKTVRHQEVQLDESKMTMMDILATAIEFRSCESGEHVVRIRQLTHDIMTEFCRLYPDACTLSEKEIDLISNAASLHDVGKIAIPDYILNKPGKLTPTEFSFIKEHPVKGCELLERIPNLQDEPLYSYAYDICRWHHERWDGKGYPDGLAGNDIPIWAQVAAIADVFDALTAPRVYKQAFSRDKAIAMICDGACGSFNPLIVTAFCNVAKKYDEVIPVSEQADFVRAPAGKDTITLMLSAFNSLISNTNDIIFLKDVDLVYRAVSPAFAAMIGLTPEEVITHTDAELFGNVTRAKRYMQDDLQLLQDGVDLVDSIESLGERDGLLRYGSTTKRLLTDSQGRMMGILGITRDITASYLSAKHYQLELRRLFQLPEKAYSSIYIDLVSWHISAENTQPVNGVQFKKHLTVEELAANALNEIVNQDTQAYQFYSQFNKETLEKIYEGGQNELALEYKRKLPEGNIVWIRDEIKFLTDPSNGHLSLLVCCYDISGERENDVSYLAYHDVLTGLLNRAYMRQCIREELTKAQGRDVRHALIMIDVDNLKYINDILGHKEGDNQLIQFAQKLQGAFRESDYVARIGGDEFLVLMRNIRQTEDVRQKAEQLNKELFWYAGDNSSLPVSASIGSACYPEDGRTLEELYEKADMAMYRIKRNGKNGYSIGI